MKRRSPSLWTRVFTTLVLVGLLNSHAGGIQAAQTRAFHDRIAQHNREVLARLGLTAPLTAAEIERRKAQARATITSSRADLLARQRAGLQEIATWSPRIWAAQDEANLRGLSRSSHHVIELVRRLTEATDGEGAAEAGRALWFERENLRDLGARMFDRGVLPEAAWERINRVGRALDALGDHPHDIDATRARAAAEATHAVLTRLVSDDEARARLSRGGLKRSPRYQGFDPLSGRPVELSTPPQPLPTRAPFSLPLPDGAGLLAQFDGVRDAQLAARTTPPSPPTSADTASTPDVPLTPAILAKAASLGNDPLAIFNFVRQSIDYLPYNGSLYGAQGTLDAGVGNDVDQASLLIGLLRAAGIPARYASGNAYLSVEQFKGMLGIEDLQAAGTALASNGVSAVMVYGPNGIDGIRMAHTWVVAQVPYTNYRGIDGSASGGGDAQWVSLDPALKGYVVEQEVDLHNNVEFDVDAFISASTELSPLNFYEDALRGWIRTTDTRCETLDQALARRVNKAEPLEILPNQVPWRLDSDRVIASSLGSSVRHTVRVEVTDSWGFTVIDKAVTTVEAYGKRLALTYPSGSGIYSATSGSLKPTLSLDGVVIAQSSGVSPGTEMPVYVILTGPNTGSEYRSHDAVAGGSYVINAWKGPVPETLIAEAEQEFSDLKAQAAAQNRLDLVISDLAGLTYYNRLYNEDKRIYGLNGWMAYTVSEAMTGSSMSTLYWFGLPSGVTRSGFSIDAEMTFGGVPLRGTYDAAELSRIAKISGFNGSFHEHKVWGEVAGYGALSTTSILQTARAKGQPIYYLDSIDEYNGVRSKLVHDSAVLNDVTNALNQGDQVVIEEREITEGPKTMSGYVIFDPDTGAGRYMISGGLSGGETTELQSLLSELASLLGYGEPISSRANMSTGSLSDQKPEQFFRANGRLYLLIYNYHSDLDLNGDLGPGWTWTFGAQLFANPTTNAVTLIQHEGVELVYEAAGAGAYTSPASVDDTLVKTASGWTLTAKQGRIRTFDNSGRLVTDTDNDGNQVRLVRDSNGYADKLTTEDGRTLVEISVNDSGKITRLEDMLGRSTSFSYTNGQVTEIVDPNGKIWAYVYGEADKLIGKVEPDGTSIEYGFDGFGRLARHTTPTEGEGFFGYDWANHRSLWQDPAGAEQLYTFDDDGQLLEHVDEVGNKSVMEYEDGRLVSHQDGRGGLTTREYDGRGNLIQEVRPDGTSRAWTYDTQNRVTAKTDADGTMTRWVYNDASNTMQVIKENGTKVVQFDDRGNVLSMSGDDGRQVTYTYDGNGNLATSTDGEGQVTQITSDAAGNITSVRNPGGDTLTLTYDGAGRVTQTRLPSGGTLQVEYTPHGDIATTTDPVGRKTTMRYDQRWLASTTDHEGRSTRFYRDPMGRVREILDPNGNAISYALDAAGRVVSTTDAFGQTTEMGYCADVGAMPCDVIDTQGNLIQRSFDSNGRLLSETTELGITTWEYDDRDRVTAWVDALGHRTEMEWNVAGNPTTITDAIGNDTTYTYDADGSLTGWTDAAGSTTTMIRDGVGQVVRILDELGRTTDLTYTADRKLASVTDPRGHTTTYQHDELGNITGELFESGDSHAYTFDAGNRKLRSTSADADIEYRYDDPLGRLSAVENHTLGLSLAIEYDALTGQRSKVSRPDGVQTYTWNKHGQLAATSLPNGKTVRYTYDDHGRLIQKVYPNRTTQVDTYDHWNRLTSRLTYNDQGILMAGMAYTYDALHRKTSATDTAGVKTTYTYDALNRLVGEKKPGSDTVYTYDAVGNRLSETVNGVLRATYTYDRTHRLTSRTENSVTTTYTWDAAGRLIGKSGGESASFVYDDAGRLTLATVGGKTMEFGYDAEGRRAWRTTADEDAWTLYDEEDAILEVDSGGAQLRGFGHGPGIDEPLALFDYNDTGTDYYYHTDGMGSVLALSDASGRLANAYSYTAFGQRTTTQSDVYNDYTFTGRRADLDTGLYDFRARVLDPKVGRFLQADPLSMADYERPRTGLAADISREIGPNLIWRQLHPQSNNPYGYVSANPLYSVDPSGEADVPIGIIDYMQGLILGLIAMCLSNIALSAAIPWLGTLAAIIGFISVMISVYILAVSLRDSGTAGAYFYNLITGLITITLGIIGFAATPLVGTIVFIIWMHVAIMFLIIGLICWP